MKEIKYNNGKKYEPINFINLNKPLNYSKSKLGQDFEEQINEANKYYLSNNIAAIYKKPTPVQVVKVDYPERNRARITEAYYKQPSTTDYNGIYKGKYIDFEAKSTKQTSFSFDRLYPHQFKHLEIVHNLGGISFLIIEFSQKMEVYILDSTHIIEKYEESKNGGRKSLSYAFIKEKGYMVPRSLKIELDYLKAINEYYKL